MTSGLEDLQLEYIQPLLKAIGGIYTPSLDPIPGAPGVDHTTGTSKGGYFLFMNGRTHLPTAYIDTLSMTGIPPDRRLRFGLPASYSCLRFAYQISGNATLKVFIAPNDAFTGFYQTATPIWQSK